MKMFFFIIYLVFSAQSCFSFILTISPICWQKVHFTQLTSAIFWEYTLVKKVKSVEGTLKQHNVAPRKSHFCESNLGSRRWSVPFIFFNSAYHVWWWLQSLPACAPLFQASLTPNSFIQLQVLLYQVWCFLLHALPLSLDALNNCAPHSIFLLLLGGGWKMFHSQICCLLMGWLWCPWPGEKPRGGTRRERRLQHLSFLLHRVLKKKKRAEAAHLSLPNWFMLVHVHKAAVEKNT